jgi:hypothetical protein
LENLEKQPVDKVLAAEPAHRPSAAARVAGREMSPAHLEMRGVSADTVVGCPGVGAVNRRMRECPYW